MKIDEAIKMLKARLECVVNLSGDKCSYSSCGDCHLCCEQGSLEEQKEYLDIAIKALEQNVKLKEAIEKMDEWVHSGNRGDCDYFIVDQIEEIINGLKKDGMVNE